MPNYDSRRVNNIKESSFVYSLVRANALYNKQYEDLAKYIIPEYFLHFVPIIIIPRNFRETL